MNNLFMFPSMSFIYFNYHFIYSRNYEANYLW